MEYCKKCKSYVPSYHICTKEDYRSSDSSSDLLNLGMDIAIGSAISSIFDNDNSRSSSDFGSSSDSGFSGFDGGDFGGGGSSDSW